MAKFSKLNVDVNNIQALSTKPNTADGLTAQGLQAKFDKAGADIKDYLNNTLTQELDDKVIATNDIRLTNSRQCNNNFDNPITARENLKIKTGTNLPGVAEENTLFFIYEE